MSNNELVIPDYLKTSETQQAAKDADSLSQASNSVPRISLKGRKFRVIEAGEEIEKSDTFEGVILAVQPDGPLFVKTFYTSGYNPNVTAPPDCGSTNGVHPDPWVTQPQSNKCQTCPKNQFGSATSASGKAAKACRDSKRLWIAKPDDLSGVVYAMNVPATSLKAVSEYGRKIKGHGIPLCAVITRFSMVDAEFPQLEFDIAGFLQADEYQVAYKRTTDREFVGNTPVIEYNGPANAATIAAPGAHTVASQVIEGTVSTTPPATVDSKAANAAIAEKW